MPRMQTALGPVNAVFSANAIDLLPADTFSDPAVSLGQTFGQIAGLDASIVSYLDGWPSGVLASVRGLLDDNLHRASRLPVTFAWAPSYDYEVTIWDVADTDATHGGITVLFKSRYPDDAHPNAVGTSN